MSRGRSTACASLTHEGGSTSCPSREVAVGLNQDSDLVLGPSSPNASFHISKTRQRHLSPGVAMRLKVNHVCEQFGLVSVSCHGVTVHQGLVTSSRPTGVRLPSPLRSPWRGPSPQSRVRDRVRLRRWPRTSPCLPGTLHGATAPASFTQNTARRGGHVGSMRPSTNVHLYRPNTACLGRT